MSSKPEVRPLTSANEAGVLYKRFEATDIQIGRMLLLLHSAWILAAPDLLAETLVYLIREIHGQDDKLFGLLVAELSKRVYHIGGAFAGGIDPTSKQDILWRIEQQIFKLVLAGIPSRQSEFLEIAFGQAVEHRTNNAVERHHASMWGNRGDVLAGPAGDDAGEEGDRIEYLADDGPGPEAILLQREDVTVRRKLYWKARRFVKNPRHLEAAILHHCEEYSIEDVAIYLGVTPVDAKNGIQTAMKQMRDGLRGAK